MKAVPWQLQRQWRQYLDSCEGNEGDTAGGVEDDMDEAVAGLGIAGQQENGQP